MAAPVYQTTGTYGQTSGGNPAASISTGAPSGVVADDIVELHLYIDTPSATVTPPAGFTEAPHSPATITTVGSQRHAIYWKRSTGSEPGSYTTTFSPNCFAEGVTIRISGCITTGSPYDDDISATDAVGSTTSPAVSLNTAAADRLLVHSATNWAGGSWTAASGFTTRASGGFGLLHVATKTQTGAGSTGTVQATCSNSNKTTAWLGALQPPASGTAFTRTVDDPAGLTDTTTPVAAFARTVDDTAGLTDSASAAAAHARTQTDTAGLTDTAATAAAHARAASDTAGLTDTTSTALAAAGTRQVDDTAGLTDSISVALSWIRTVDDLLALTDQPAQAAVYARAATDGAGLSDAAAAQLLSTADQQVIDRLGLTDSVCVCMATIRPNTGTTGRPNIGIIARPFTGTVKHCC